MIKKILLSILAFFYISGVYASSYELPRKDLFKFLCENISEIPKSYKYINLEFKDIQKSDENYLCIQKLVFTDLIENKKIKLNLNLPFNAFLFYSLLEKQTGFDFVNEKNQAALKKINVSQEDLNLAKSVMLQIQSQLQLQVSGNNLYNIFGSSTNSLIFEDVYNTLTSDHYDSEKINKQDLIYSSIEGLAKGSGDKFTTFFPPVEAKDFDEGLSGEFEGIGSYVDMETPGVLKIVSPLSGSPSEKNGLKGGDIVKKINGEEITKNTTLKEAVSKIKGPSGTKVILEILRGTEKLTFEVTREKIVINDVEYKVINDKYFYIKFRMFGDKIFSQTTDALTQLKDKKDIKKIIFDFRNNPGGYLDGAVNLLSLFIEKSKPVAQIKYKTGIKTYNSYGYNVINLGDYEVYILANSGTASASEIFIGTIKDYFPNVKIIGEKTYGKGSVQTIKSYVDGSSFKYTIAKWFTGKSMTGIDGIGISPDVELQLDVEKFKTGVDNQLDYILNLK